MPVDTSRPLADDWERIDEYAINNEIFNCTILSVNLAGGLLAVEGTGLFAFLPHSQYRGIADAVTENNIGDVVRCRILDADRDAGRVIVTHSQVMQEEAMESVALNTLVEGFITSTRPFGAFVEFFSGAKGLLHISDISKLRVTDVEDVLPVGTKIKAIVIGKTPGKGLKVATKYLEKNHGDMLRDVQMVMATADEMMAVYLEERQVMEEEARKVATAAMKARSLLKRDPDVWLQQGD
jgi:ribosomal protein S1